jgi:MSHA biogenesis protein MshO
LRPAKPIINPTQRGFTLIEAIMVIVITGIVAGMVAVFIRPAIDAYMDSARRATLTDIADTAARRLTRELQGALPNSVRVNGGPLFIEFVPINDAGRYRAEAGTAAGDDPLDFTSGADTTFNVLGPPVTVLPGDSLVVYNLGIAGADVYGGAPNNRRAAAVGVGLGTVTFTSTGVPLPFASPGSRFQIVGTPVSYVCDLGVGGTNTLWRYTGYGFQAAQPTTLAALNALAGVTRAALATNVTACSFTYTPGPLQHNGLVSLSLTITQAGESVTLQQQVNVDNVP